jgi:hypothetical protein
MIDLILLALFVYLVYSNGSLAKKLGKNGIVWGLITFLGFMGGNLVGSLIVMSLFYKGTIGDVHAWIQFLMDNPSKQWLISACALGGGVLIRYILERKKAVSQENE